MATKAQAKQDVKEGNETVTHAEAADDSAAPAVGEVRVGLATGSHAGNPDIPDKLPINTSVEGVKPDEPTSAALSVAVTSEGKKGPAA